jgi:hypothetical protein
MRNLAIQIVISNVCANPTGAEISMQIQGKPRQMILDVKFWDAHKHVVFENTAKGYFRTGTKTTQRGV